MTIFRQETALCMLLFRITKNYLNIPRGGKRANKKKYIKWFIILEDIAKDLSFSLQFFSVTVHGQRRSIGNYETAAIVNT